MGGSGGSAACSVLSFGETSFVSASNASFVSVLFAFLIAVFRF
jgi:hypothetical protein